jgi:hypothetical protein
MSFLLSTFLDWKVTFEAIALQNPTLCHEKVSLPESNK